MSPRKLTEDDKQEILQLYRNSEATTSTLANRYEVSSSTISRFLKNKLSSTEYEDLIQQKRLARTPRGEKIPEKKEAKSKKEKTAKVKKTRKKSLSKAKPESAEASEKDNVIRDVEPIKITEPTVDVEPIEIVESSEPTVKVESESEPKPTPKRRRRRRSSAGDRSEPELTSTVIEAEAKEEITEQVEEEVAETITPETTEEEKPVKLIIDKKIKKDTIPDELGKSSKSNNLILKNDKPKIVTSSFDEDEDEEDNDDSENEVNIITLKEMLGEDLEDINDEDDDEDDGDWEEEETTVSYPKRDSSSSDLEIIPLSQASFPRTCYLVIDRSAELIVKPLAEFADLGEIPQYETRQKTLPVFDNHRIAKRFSNRRERVIKLPDGRMLQKTSRHLQEKGITRLLIDGQIYSLST